jgi:hypothetical protein
MKVIGNKVNHISMVDILGKVVDTMKGNIIWEKNRDLENICLMMEKYMKDCGKMGNNMEKVK